MANRNQTARVSTGKINTVDDSAIGGPAGSMPGVTGRCPGQLGQIIELSEEEAQKMDSALHGGSYKYIQFKSGSTQANAKGQLLFYASAADEEAHIATPDPTTASLSRVAGVGLLANTKAYYGWIQTDGLATIRTKSSVTDTTDGVNAVAVSDTVGKVDGIADGTAVTNLMARTRIGTFAEAPANDSLKLVHLALPTRG
jgi:hypothetical protein